MASDEEVKDQPEELSYRLVRRKYYCYMCQKEFNKMVSALDVLTCDQCQEGFCEIINNSSSNSNQSQP